MSILKELIEKLSKALDLWIEGMEIGRQTWKLNKEIQEWELEESITQDKTLFEFEWDFKHENT